MLAMGWQANTGPTSVSNIEMQVCGLNNLLRCAQMLVPESCHYISWDDICYTDYDSLNCVSVPYICLTTYSPHFLH